MRTLGTLGKTKWTAFVITAGLMLSGLGASEAKALQSRYWWKDLGSFGGKPFGQLYLFGAPGQKPVDGWYTGTRISISGDVLAGRQTGLAYKPTATGVIIDDGFSRNEISFVHFYDEYEVLVNQDRSGYFYWMTTRSPFTPSNVSQLFYK